MGYRACGAMAHLKNRVVRVGYPAGTLIESIVGHFAEFHIDLEVSGPSSTTSECTTSPTEHSAGEALWLNGMAIRSHVQRISDT